MAALAPVVFVEKLRNLRALHVYINDPAYIHAVDLQCRVADGSIELHIPSSSTSAAAARLLRIRVPAECVVDASRATVVRAADHALVKLPIVQDTRFEDGASQTVELISANEMAVRNFGAVCCSFCGKALVPAPPQRVLPLPSSYWQEVTDLWYCHNESKLAALTERPISAVPGVYLIGDNHFMVHEHDMANNISRQLNALSVMQSAPDASQSASAATSSPALQPAQHATSEAAVTSTAPQPLDDIEDNRYVQCARCGSVIGQLPLVQSLHKRVHTAPAPVSSSADPSSSSSAPAASTAKDYADSAGTESTPALRTAQPNIRVFKSQVSSRCSPVAPNVFDRYSLETFIALDLLAICQARMHYRFLIRDAQDWCTIALTVTGVDSAISVCTQTVLDQQADALSPCIKVLYSIQRCCSNHSGDHDHAAIASAGLTALANNGSLQAMYGPDKAMPSSTAGAKQPVSVELLEYPLQFVLTLADVLQQSTQWLPASCRQLPVLPIKARSSPPVVKQQHETPQQHQHHDHHHPHMHHDQAGSAAASAGAAQARHSAVSLQQIGFLRKLPYLT